MLINVKFLSGIHPLKALFCIILWLYVYLGKPERSPTLLSSMHSTVLCIYICYAQSMDRDNP